MKAETNPYTWYNAFNVKIASLNGGGGFAGFTDWRLPTVTELQSIMNYGAVTPTAYTEFNTACAATCTVTTCSCTQSNFYWSSTNYQYVPTSAWCVYFDVGGLSPIDKGFSYYVRAVRGGP